MKYSLTRVLTITLIMICAVGSSAAAVRQIHVRPSTEAELRDDPVQWVYYPPFTEAPPSPPQASILLTDVDPLTIVVPQFAHKPAGGGFATRLHRDGSTLTLNAYFIFNGVVTRTIYGPHEYVLPIGTLNAGTYNLAVNYLSTSIYDYDGTGAGFLDDPQGFATEYELSYSQYTHEFTVIPGPHTLSIVSGSGGGTHTTGEVVAISADSPPVGMVFDEWIGDTAAIADVEAASTTITMPATDATVTATYTSAGDLNRDGIVDVMDLNGVLIDWGKLTVDLTFPESDVNGDGIVNIIDLNYVLVDWGKSFHTLTVENGSGDGTYSAGELIAISADTAPANTQFDQWTGDTAGIADIYAEDTDLTMPTSDATVTAAYSFIHYDLTVESGSGDGSYTYGQTVSITADTPPTGLDFYRWVGDTVATPTAASTTITIPDHDVTVTATYKGIYTLTILNPSYPSAASRTSQHWEGDVFNINTGAPPVIDGQIFDQWQGDIATILDIYAESTNMTMPNSDATITATYKDP